MKNVIAVIWDCDKTLIDGYMQDPMFAEYGVETKQFWADENKILDEYQKTGVRVNRDTYYLNYFINYIYDNFDAFKLVLCCSEGTRYSNYVHELVELEVSQTEEYYQQLRRLGKAEGVVNYDLHHMITSAYFTAVFETVVHDMSREQAIGYVNELAVFFNCGWSGLLRLK